MTYGPTATATTPARMTALHHVGELVQAARRAGEQAFRPPDWRAVMTAERFYHDPEGVG